MPSARTELRWTRAVRRYPLEAIGRIRFVKPRGDGRCQQVHQLLATKIAQLDEQRALLDDLRRTLRALADQCEATLRSSADPECPIIAKI